MAPSYAGVTAETSTISGTKASRGLSNEVNYMGTNADAAPAPSWLLRVLIGRKPKRTLARIVVLVTVSFVVFKFVLLPVRVEGGSMLPTYKDKGVNFIDRKSTRLNSSHLGISYAV